MSGVLSILMTGSSGQISVNPAAATGLGDTNTVTTNFVTVTMTPPGSYTFLWEYVSGNTEISIVNSPSSVNQRWSVSLVPGEDKSAEWKVTALLFGTPVASAEVFVQLVRL